MSEKTPATALPTQAYLQLQWGWITPGTGETNRREQCEDHLAFLAQPVVARTRHFLFTHCGWWFDLHATPGVLDLTRRNPEPKRALTPCPPEVARTLADYVRAGRLEYVLYPYAACVAEATTGEGLMRGFRLSLTCVEDALGVKPRAMLNHDYCYGLDWGTVQMPQMARMLGMAVVLTGKDGFVQGPDGTKVRTAGHDVGLKSLGQVAAREEVRFLPLELHQNLRFHEGLADAGSETARGRAVEPAAITLDEYLARQRGQTTFDSRKIGSKGWYGGHIDALRLEQHAKTVELRLPAVEALALQVSGGEIRGRGAEEIRDLWKGVLIVMDNHTLWQCHDYGIHFLPQARRLEEMLRNVETRWMAAALSEEHATGNGANVAVFNPTPWARDIAVATEDGTIVAPDVPGWGVRVTRREAATAHALKDEDALTLSRGNVTCRLNEHGELIGWRQDSVARPQRAGESTVWAGILTRWTEERSDERFTQEAGSVPQPFMGALTARVEFVVPEAGGTAGKLEVVPVGRAGAGVAGDAYLMQVEHLGGSGEVMGQQWIPLRSMHWGRAGMPQRRSLVEGRELSWPATARRLRVTLWMMVDDVLDFGRPMLRLAGGTVLGCTGPWQLHLQRRYRTHEPRDVQRRVVHADVARKVVRFSGQLPDMRYEMDVTLSAVEAAVQYQLRVEIPRAVDLGLTTPPFSAEDGSMLGVNCERPYVPGLAVLARIPGAGMGSGGATYYADKPFYIQQMLDEPETSWHTDQRDWWMGMSPFIGMNMAAVQSADGQLGMFTRGLKHFFRWRAADSKECLGLSLGATLLHVQTQGHSVLPECPVHHLAKRTTFDPYLATPFLRAQGTYEFAWAIRPAAVGERARRQLWREAQQFALPGSAVATHAPAGLPVEGIAVTPAEVVVSGLEWVSADLVRLRLCNLAGEEVEAEVRLPRGLVLGKEREGVRGEAGGVRVRMRGYGVEEVEVRRGEGR